MALARTGTPSQVDGGGGDGSTSVTVPGDCTLVLAFWDHWDDNDDTTLASLSIDGDPFTIETQLAEGWATDASGVGVATLANPSTGSQTFAWAWSSGGARTEGGVITLVYLTGSGEIRDTAVDSEDGTDQVQVTLDTETTDLLIVYASCWTGGGPAVIVGATTTFINDATDNAREWDIAEVAASATSTTVTMTGESYSAMAAISLFESGGGTEFTEDVSGAITPTGSLVRETAKKPAGSLSAAGAIDLATAKVLAGSIAPAGALSLLKKQPLSLSGELAPAGSLSLVKKQPLSLAGEIEPTGALVRKTGKALAGALAPVGTLIRLTRKLLAGALTPAGEVDPQLDEGGQEIAPSGEIAPAGDLNLDTGKVLAGSLTPAGTLTQETAKKLAGSLAPAGALDLKIGKLLGGTITPAGARIRLDITKYLAGAIAPAGTLTRVGGEETGLVPIACDTLTPTAVSADEFTLALVSDDSFSPDADSADDFTLTPLTID
jgi:hypothetical protein